MCYTQQYVSDAVSPLVGSYYAGNRHLRRAAGPERPGSDPVDPGASRL